jgi:hypothetical protein
MIETLFAAYTEKANTGRDAAFDRLVEAIRAQEQVDEALTNYTLEAERAAYRAGFADGLTIAQEAAEISRNAG